jgi:hypothetical protein
LEFASEIFKSGESLLARFIGIKITGDLSVYERFVNAQRYQSGLGGALQRALAELTEFEKYGFRVSDQSIRPRRDQF